MPLASCSKPKPAKDLEAVLLALAAAGLDVGAIRLLLRRAARMAVLVVVANIVVLWSMGSVWEMPVRWLF